jgi:hypothetical protein
MVTKTKKIFVGGLSATSTIEDVKGYFEQFGRVGVVTQEYCTKCTCKIYTLLLFTKRLTISKHFYMEIINELAHPPLCYCFLTRYTNKVIGKLY